MRIIIFGAAGMVGSRTAVEALARGHEVTAVVRDPNRELPQGVGIEVGDAGDPAAAARLIEGHDAAVSAVRAPVGQEALQVDATAALLKGAAVSGVRLLIVGGAATLRVPDSGKAVLDDPRYIAEEWRAVAEASAAQHRRCIEEREADWTYLSPPAMLAPGARTGAYRLGRDDLLTDAAGISRISAEDLAVAIVDELEHPKHRRTRFTVAA
ncbi:NAD(P)H-binding protein [Glycomyces sp. TRM65418]|uniref:NAD(P)-dependent oxidoreductase n=1 Tax=Glycomyces sp. TRM65418 TaxID=2867006 RepID=UPI001CE667AB|nr:NAD(P)H-binding protein [Glycomyces sp. TRM65418]MCC3762135.1 NAD(P)H-binding protein [Glycomyces sp. TRM65418]QZD56199.1 NAD(P)H-binding protein [Glycomyces sp. TRM65418]